MKSFFFAHITYLGNSGYFWHSSVFLESFPVISKAPEVLLEKLWDNPSPEQPLILLSSLLNQCDTLRAQCFPKASTGTPTFGLPLAGGIILLSRENSSRSRSAPHKCLLCCPGRVRHNSLSRTGPAQPGIPGPCPGLGMGSTFKKEICCPDSENGPQRGLGGFFLTWVWR